MLFIFKANKLKENVSWTPVCLQNENKEYLRICAIIDYRFLSSPYYPMTIHSLKLTLSIICK